MTDKEIEAAIHDLTEIVTAQAELITSLQRRVAYLERYAKKRRPTMFDALADGFSGALGAAMGR